MWMFCITWRVGPCVGQAGFSGSDRQRASECRSRVWHGVRGEKRRGVIRNRAKGGSRKTEHRESEILVCGCAGKTQNENERTVSAARAVPPAMSCARPRRAPQ